MVTAEGPLGGLPSAEPVIFEGQQLELVVAEIRFLARSAELDPDQGLSIRAALDALEAAPFRMQPAQEQRLQMTVGPEGASPSVEMIARGWQFASADGSTLITFMPDALTVQATHYVHWRHTMLPILQVCVPLVEQTLGIQLRTRLGLRYVNRLTRPIVTETQGWVGAIPDSIIGAVSHPEIGKRIVSSQQQHELTLGDEIGAVLRHGTFRDSASNGAISYIIDVDVFDGHSSKFVARETIDRFKPMNRTAFSIFRLMLTPDYLQGMKPVPFPDDAQGEEHM